MRPCHFPVYSLVSKYQVLVYRPHNEADDPNPTLISPWREPYTARAQRFPVIYHVTKYGNPTEPIVHLGRNTTVYLSRPLSPILLLSTVCSYELLFVPDLEGSL